MHFANALTKNCINKNSYLLAGLDPQIEIIPDFLINELQQKYPVDSDFFYNLIFDFCSLGIDAVSEHTAVVKPNIAFFEYFGLPGIKAFNDICDYANRKGLLVLVDAKRGDISNTGAAYCDAFFKGKHKLFNREVEALSVDAITINPYLGLDTLEPWLKTCEQFGKGLFILLRTSNPGSGYFQARKSENQMIMEILAKDLCKISEEIEQRSTDRDVFEHNYSNIGAVVGATYPEEAIALRKLMPHGIFLIPGAGAQGADYDMAVAGFDQFNRGAIINSSRALFKSAKNAKDRKDFLLIVEQAARTTKIEINAALARRIKA